MPVYWIGALLGLLFVGVMRWRPIGDALLDLHATATPTQIAARFGGYSGLWPEEVYVGNGTLNTVAVEILIYLAYPLFFVGAMSGRWQLLGLIAIGMQLLALWLQPYVNSTVLFSGVLIAGFFWYLGALAAHWRVKHGWRVRGWWIGACWAFFLLLKKVPHFYGLNMLKQAIWSVLCMGFIVWLVEWEKQNEKLQESVLARLLRWLGSISYPLYAVHTPIILLVNWAMLTWTVTHSYSWQLVICLVACLIAATAVHQGVEKRFYRSRTLE